MPRVARTVFPNLPHHITQRGNRQEDIFFTDDDRQIYLEWLRFYCKKYQVKILSYCLMTNHIHLILTPYDELGLQQVLKPLHMRYAQHINRIKKWKGHLWQGRFFSSALDDPYTWSAIRYVERNPVDAGMVERAEQYPWSSAAAHCGLKSDQLLSSLPAGFAITEDEWSQWLSLSESSKNVDILRRNIEKGLPCGSDGFINDLERSTDRKLRYQPQGRPIKG